MSQVIFSEVRFNILLTLDDILNGEDKIGLFDDVVPLPPLHNNTSDKKAAPSSMPDFIAKSVRCRDFSRYKPLFDEVRSGLASGDLLIRRSRYSAANLAPGQFYVINGLYVLIRHCDREHIELKNDKKLFRVQLIYSNGTESEPFAQSLLKALSQDKESTKIHAETELGRKILDGIKEKVSQLRQDQADSAQASISGYIYILSTKSHNQTILDWLQSNHLVKIGFCTTTVEERIKNAANDTTYLCAPVELIKSYRCRGDINPHEFEKIVHAVLAERRCSLTLTDPRGKAYKPREWFTVSPQTACEVVERIIDHSISQYRLNPLTGTLVRKED